MTASLAVSVIVCTYNPAPHRIDATIRALAGQTMPVQDFEIVVVDNASAPQLCDVWGLKNLRLTREPRQGLTHARLRGMRETKAPVLVFVDDDNLLSPDYLMAVAAGFSRDSLLGGLGGRIDPEWEAGPPPAWTNEFLDLLAVRDLGEEPISAGLGVPPRYPACAPVGAGMAVRREALAPWAETLCNGVATLDRTGSSLSSGGDNDIVLHMLRAGWQVGYNPTLRLRHIIPAARTAPGYLGRLTESIMISWIDVLDHHGLRPWGQCHPALLHLRLARLFLRATPWISPAHYIRWKARQGQIIGRSKLSAKRSVAGVPRVT